MFSRRDFLKCSTVGVAATSISGWMQVLAARAAQVQQKHKSCIVLYMGGGPSQLDSFDMKPDAPAEYRGPLKTIPTSVPGILISECLPKLAGHMQHAAIIRSMSTLEGEHARASYHMHTGYRLGTAGLDYPSLGAIVSAEMGRPDASLPNYVLTGIGVNQGRAGYGQGAGFLGPRHRPLETEAGPGLVYAKPTLDMKAFDQQVNLLDEMEQGFYKNYKSPAAKAHAETAQRAVGLMHSKELKAFDLAQEPASGRDAYGNTQFGRGCLLARRLVEVGVPFIEVGYAGWDHHGGIYEGQKGIQPMLGVVDQAMSALIGDLKSRGLLDSTLIVWMGEFGRTPKLTEKSGGGGRDHYAKAWSTVLAGGGIKAGQVIGKTDKHGALVEDRPVTVSDFLATICTILDIDYTKNHKVEPAGRPIAIVEKKKLKPITELCT